MIIKLLRCNISTNLSFLTTLVPLSYYVDYLHPDLCVRGYGMVQVAALQIQKPAIPRLSEVHRL